jgi:hypothetical protein
LREEVVVFLVLEEDTCLYVYASPSDAVADIEALDVDTVRAAFDEEARPYRVEWIRPNRYGKIVGPLGWAQNGDYCFVIAGEPDPSELAAVIRRATAIFPVKYDASVRELERRLTGP